MLERVAHTLVKEGRLQSATPRLWNRGGTAKQRRAFMKAQDPSGTRLAAKLSKKH